MTTADNDAVAKFFFEVYDPWRWFWLQLLHGVLLARPESPALLFLAVSFLFFLTGNLFFSISLVALVVFGLALTLTYQFWMYVKRSPDLSSKTSYETYCKDGECGFWLAFCCEDCGGSGYSMATAAIERTTDLKRKAAVEGKAPIEGSTAILGTAALVRKSDRQAEIFRMAVSREAERNGIASRLLRHVEKVASERGFETLRLWTSNAQHKGFEFYLSRGFHLVERKWHTNRPMPITVNVLEKRI